MNTYINRYSYAISLTYIFKYQPLGAIVEFLLALSEEEEEEEEEE